MTIDDIPVEVTRKTIRSIRLRILPPEGTVRLSVPARMSDKAIREFLASRSEWIRKHRPRALHAKPEYGEGEKHWFLGRAYFLHIVARPGRNTVSLDGETLTLFLRPDSPKEKREALLLAWYREQLEARIPPLITHYGPLMDVSVEAFGIKTMKTRWGSCNVRTGKIWLNLELAKKPPECLEYVVVHEMAHLIEPSHNGRFKALMDRYFPHWRHVKALLNADPPPSREPLAL